MVGSLTASSPVPSQNLSLRPAQPRQELTVVVGVILGIFFGFTAKNASLSWTYIIQIVIMDSCPDFWLFNEKKIDLKAYECSVTIWVDW